MTSCSMIGRVIEVLSAGERGRTDQLHALLVRLSARVHAHERRQERAVDVDHRHGEQLLLQNRPRSRTGLRSRHRGLFV